MIRIRIRVFPPALLQSAEAVTCSVVEDSLTFDLSNQVSHRAQTKSQIPERNCLLTQSLELLSQLKIHSN